MTFGPDQATCEVRVYREGPLAAVGHDLLLRAADVQVQIEGSPPEVTARVGIGSLEVVTALREGRPNPGVLNGADVREIQGKARAAVTGAAAARDVRFRSTEVTPDVDGFRVRGVLELAGVSRPVVAVVVREGGRLVARLRIRQPDFGIQPYRALLGALRVQPEVDVEVSIPA